MAHDSRTGCSGRLAGSGRSGLASGSGRSVGRLAFWARLALVVLLGLLVGLGVAWVSARRPEWRPVAVFALVGSAGLLVRRYWPQWLWRYTGFVLLGLGWLTARRWGVPLGWEVFLASAMLYGLGLGVWDAVRERRGCGVGCLPGGCGPECGMRGRRYVPDAKAAGSEQVSTFPDNRNASVAELAELEHRLRVSRRRLELLRPLSEESNRITDEILRLYKLSDEELLREVGLPRASLATIREKLPEFEIATYRARAEAAEAELAQWRSGALRLGTWSHTHKTDRGTEDRQRQVAGQVGEGSASASGPRAVHVEMPKLDYSEAELLCLAKALISYRSRGLSQTELQNAAAKAGISLESAEQFVREWEAAWPAIRQLKPSIQNSDENPSELDATAGPNVSSQLDLPFSALDDAAQQRQQIQAALRQGDQDIAANRGHDLSEVLADLDEKPPAQPPAWQKPILLRHHFLVNARGEAATSD